jgi:nicotinamide mononucleotide transporter
MSWAEVVAVLFFIISIVLTIRKNIWLWPSGLVAELFYLYIFYSEKMYADSGLQIIYLFQSIYGWYYWAMVKTEKEVDVTLLSISGRVYVLFGVAAITGATYFVLITYTDASVPYWDALAASLSLAANWLLARRIFENWVLWILADLIYIGLFIYKDLYLSSGIYLIFIFLSVAGLIKWKKELVARKVLFR